MKPGTARTVVRLGGASLLAALMAAEVYAAAPGLFESHDLLRVRLEAPLGTVLGDARKGQDDIEHAGLLSVGAQAIPVRVSAFGKTRLQVCRIPPLEIRPDPAAATGTPFEGEEILRLVTHCGADSESMRFVLLEYLVYRMYALLTEPALAVRLAEIEYGDRQGPRSSQPAFAFFVEDIGEAAARRNLEWLAIDRQRLADLDGAELSLFTLFQFAIGNTDWSVLTSPPGERCCHNVAVLAATETGRRYLLPFDFDSAGIVNAPYAAPVESLPIRSVTQRYYRGFCANNEHLKASITRFRKLEPQLRELIDETTVLDAASRANAQRYLDGLYATIANEKKLGKQILRRCR